MALTNPQSADHIAQQDGSFEPQRLNNFSIEIPLDGADRDLIVAGLHGVKLPAQKNTPQKIEFQNESRKVAGQAEVDDGNISIKDFADQDTLGAILRWRKKVYDPVTGKIGLAKNYKRTCNLILHAPDGSFERIGKLIGVWPIQDPEFEGKSEDPAKRIMEVPLSIDKIDWSGSITGA